MNEKLNRLIGGMVRQHLAELRPPFVGAVPELATRSVIPELATRSVIPDPQTPQRQCNSQVALITASQRVVVARWQAPDVRFGAPCTIWGSGAQLGGQTPGGSNDLRLIRDVQAHIQVTRGGVVTVEVLPWPAVGFMRRAVASEVLVTAIGAAAFTSGTTTGYRVGAAVVDGFDPADSQCREQYALTVLNSMETRAQLRAPTGAREFLIKCYDAALGTTGTFVFHATRNDGTLLATDTESIDFSEAADWIAWPQRFSGAAWATSLPDNFGIHFRV